MGTADAASGLKDMSSDLVEWHYRLSPIVPAQQLSHQDKLPSNWTIRSADAQALLDGVLNAHPIFRRVPTTFRKYFHLQVTQRRVYVNLATFAVILSLHADVALPSQIGHSMC